MEHEEVKVLYRYNWWFGFEDDFLSEPFHSIELKKYKVTKHTPKGFKIGKKFVLAGEGKRFAYSTKELALYGLKMRKQSQFRILNNQLESTKLALKEIEKFIIK